MSLGHPVLRCYLQYLLSADGAAVTNKLRNKFRYGAGVHPTKVFSRLDISLDHHKKRQ
jgi:hypothetical protein